MYTYDRSIEAAFTAVLKIQHRRDMVESYSPMVTPPILYIHTMVPCDTLTPRALRVTAHATCQWVLVRFELAIFGSQAERSNHYTSVAAYILQCSFIPCVLVVLSITPLAIARGVIDSTPLGVFFSRKTPRLRLVFFLVYCHSLLKSFSLNVCR